MKLNINKDDGLSSYVLLMGFCILIYYLGFSMGEDRGREEFNQLLNEIPYYCEEIDCVCDDCEYIYYDTWMDRYTAWEVGANSEGVLATYQSSN
jgi:hypothetical protein